MLQSEYTGRNGVYWAYRVEICARRCLRFEKDISPREIPSSMTSGVPLHLLHGHASGGVAIVGIPLDLPEDQSSIVSSHSTEESTTVRTTATTPLNGTRRSTYPSPTMDIKEDRLEERPLGKDGKVKGRWVSALKFNLNLNHEDFVRPIKRLAVTTKLQ